MYSWLALINEFTSSTKNNHESLNFPTETENRCIHKIISPRISFNSQPMKISPHGIKWFYSIFTRCDIFLLMVYSLFLFRLSFLKLFLHINHLCTYDKWLNCSNSLLLDNLATICIIYIYTLFLLCGCITGSIHV